VSGSPILSGVAAAARRFVRGNAAVQAGRSLVRGRRNGPKLGAEMAYGAGISAAGGTAGGNPAPTCIVLERQNRNDQHESDAPTMLSEIEAGLACNPLGSMKRETAQVARQNQV